MEKEIKQAARALDFEHAATLRDEIGRVPVVGMELMRDNVLTTHVNPGGTVTGSGSAPVV